MTESKIIEAYVYRLLFNKQSITIKDSVTGEDVYSLDIMEKYLNDPQKCQTILMEKGSSLNKDEKLILLNKFINNEELLFDYIKYNWNRSVPKYVYTYVFRKFINNEDILFKLFKCNDHVYNECFIQNLKISDKTKEKLNAILTLTKLN